MNRSPIQWFLTIAGLSGIASIFLSFTWSVSPVEAVLEGFAENVRIFLLGAPSLLSVVISASLIRWNLTGRSSLLEQIISYLIGFSMVAVVISTIIFVLSEGSREGRMPVIFSVGTLIAGIFLVIRNHRLGKFKNLSPIMLMQTAYLGDGIFCLIGSWGSWGGWQIGAYFTLVTVIVYAAQMVWISCQKKTISAVKPQEL
ncbi:MAG: hypothetical protein MUP16_02515 [Sedimentisphaerales bacterium]|nr:hypothetical protein [Sedimentisphaerales bacterium]